MTAAATEPAQQRDLHVGVGLRTADEERITRQRRSDFRSRHGSRGRTAYRVHMTRDGSDLGRVVKLPCSRIAATAVPQMFGYRMPPMPGVHRGLPSPYLTLVFSLNGPLPIQVPEGDRLRAGTFSAPVGGLHTRPVLLPPAVDAVGRVAPVQRGIQLAVHPFAACALFGLPATALSGQVLELADLVHDGDELIERLNDDIDGPTAAALVTGWLDRRLSMGPRGQLPAELLRAWQLIVGSGGCCRIGDVASDVGWSRRHLTTRLRAEIGLGAKDLARMARFQLSRSMLLTGRLPLADVAADCGYSDQPHLTAEWRQFAGCTPGQWIAGELPTLAPADHHDTNSSHSSKT